MKENNAMRFAAMALLIGVAASANAKTYYKIGVDKSGWSSFSGTYKPNEGESTSAANIGWAKSSNGAIEEVIAGVYPFFERESAFHPDK